METQNPITKILGEEIHQKISDLWDENDSSIVRAFGLYSHDRCKVVVVTDDVQNAKKHLGDYLSETLWLCDSQEYVVCDECGLVLPIEETYLKDGDVLCGVCK